MRREFTYSPVAPPLPTVVSAPTGLVLAAGRAFQAPEQHRNFGGAAPNNLTAIDIDDCRTKVAIKVHGQVLKVLRGRLYDQHILYSCVP